MSEQMHEVVADDSVRTRSEELASRFASFPDQSSRTIKAGIRSHLGIDPETWFASSSNNALMNAAQVRQ